MGELMPQDPFADLTPNARPVMGQRRETADDPFADLIPTDPYKPVGRATPRDASQTKATTQNVTGRRNDWPDAIRTLVQGASFRAGDEIEAGIRAPFSNQTYGEIVGDIRGGLKSFRKEQPAASASLEILGGFASGAGAAKALGTAAPAMSVREAAKTAAQAGAITGGTTGFMGGETARERVTGGVVGTAAGGVLGGLLGAGAQKVSQKVAQRSTPRTDRIVLDAMKQDKLDPTKVRQALVAEPNAEVSMADMGGDAMRRLAGTAALTPTEAGSALRSKMASRALSGGEDFGGLLQSTSGVTRENVNTAQAAMNAARGRNSGPLFEAAAKSGPVADPRLSDLLATSPEAAKAYSKMMVAAGRKKLAVPTLDDAIAGQPIDARAAHWLKLELDGISGAARKQAKTATEGMTTTTAAQIAQDAKALRTTLADVIPGYKDALKTYAKASGEMRAYKTALKGARQQGDVESIQQFANAKAEDVAALLAGMPAEQQAAYRAGGVQNLLRNTEDGTAAARTITRMIDNPAQQQKLRALFDGGAQGDQQFATFLRGAGTQRNQRALENEVIGGSQTAMRSTANEALRGQAGFLEEAAQRGSASQAAQSKFFQWLAQKRLGSAAEGVSERMMPRSKADLDKMMEAYQQMLIMQQGANPSTRAFSAGGAAIGAGTGRVTR